MLRAPSLQSRKLYIFPIRFPYVASEIFACEIWSLHEATVSDHSLLADFWSYLDKAPPLNPVTTGYFCKVNMLLLQKVTKEMFAFLTSRNDLIPKIINHLGCPSMVDLLLKLVSCDDPGYGINMLDVCIL